MVSMGDLNGDGKDDVALGAPYHSTELANVGAVYLLKGPLSGTLSPTNAFATVLGEQADDRLGRSLANAGDINNDGKTDLLIGLEGTTRGRSSSRSAVLFYGPLSGELIANDATVAARFVVANVDDYLGRAICAGDDLNGDGHSDLVLGVGQRTEDNLYPGAAYLYFGGAGL